MQNTAMRKTAVLVLTALMIAATALGVVPAIADADEQAGTRTASSSGSRVST